jgi:methyl-accepting chemotaxis protein
MLGEMSPKTLVEALRDAIKDVNTRSSEHFGENFKQLNDAVGKLVSWQEQYKSYIETAIECHTQIVSSMKVASGRYEQLAAGAEAFSAITKDLSSLLSTLKVQKQQLIAALAGLSQLLQAASGSLP